MKKGIFTRFSGTIAHVTGSGPAFTMAALIVIVWAVTGPIFKYSDTWQLVINTGTTIVTFLMVFLIQNTQNRDSHAVQLKLDELIYATKDAHNALMDIEELGEAELQRIRDYYQELACKARKNPDQNIKNDKNFPLYSMAEEGLLKTETDK